MLAQDDIFVSVEGRKVVEIPGQASRSTPMGVEVRGTFSEAGKVMRGSLAQAEIRQIILRHSSAAHPDFYKQRAVC